MIDLAAAHLSVTAPAHFPRAGLAAATKVHQHQVDARLDIAQRAVDAELALVLGGEVVLEHLVQQRLWLIELVALILQLHALGRVLVPHSAPRVQQVYDAALNAAQPSGALLLVHRLLLHPAQERFEQRCSSAGRTSLRCSAPRGGDNGARAWRAKSGSGASEPTVEARAENGVTLATSTAR